MTLVVLLVLQVSSGSAAPKKENPSLLVRQQLQERAGGKGKEGACETVLAGKGGKRLFRGVALQFKTYNL